MHHLVIRLLEKSLKNAVLVDFMSFFSISTVVWSIFWMQTEHIMFLSHSFFNDALFWYFLIHLYWENAKIHWNSTVFWRFLGFLIHLFRFAKESSKIESPNESPNESPKMTWWEFVLPILGVFIIYFFFWLALNFCDTNNISCSLSNSIDFYNRHVAFIFF